jgi:hypothetical protein
MHLTMLKLSSPLKFSFGHHLGAGIEEHHSPRHLVGHQKVPPTLILTQNLGLEIIVMIFRHFQGQ